MCDAPVSHFFNLQNIAGQYVLLKNVRKIKKRKDRITMKKFSKLLSTLFAIVITMSSISLPAFAKDMKIPGGNIKTYVMTTKNNTPVYNTSKTSDKKKIGTIYATDLITITKYSNTTGRLYVTYPTAKGAKSGWIEAETIGDDGYIAHNISDFQFNSGNNMYVAKKKITAYRRSGHSEELGYISKNDVIRCFNWLNEDYVQVIYPISGGYKMGWIKTSDLKNNCKPLS